jgi:predicted Zn-dependent protease
MLMRGDTTMPEQFVNQETTKADDLTATEPTAENRVQNVAEKAAQKSTKTVKRFDQDQTIFSK